MKLENLLNEFFISGLENGMPLPMLEATDIGHYMSIMRWKKEKEDKKELQKIDDLGL